MIDDWFRRETRRIYPRILYKTYERSVKEWLLPLACVALRIAVKVSPIYACACLLIAGQFCEDERDNLV